MLYGLPVALHFVYLIFIKIRSMSEQDSEKKRDPHDGDYIGNIWGWRFSLFGGAIILLLLIVIIYRHIALGVPIGMEPEEGQQEELVDPPGDTTLIDENE